MKKKLLTLLLAVCCILPCSMVLTACGGESNSAHTHKFDSWMYDNDNPTQHYHTCECGETEYANHTFAYEDTSTPDTTHWTTCTDCGYEVSENHSYNKGICNCGYVPVTTGFTFEYVADDQSYKVTGLYLSSYNDLDYIRIPAFYDDGENGYYSVRYIGENAFKNNSNIDAKKIIIPNTVNKIEDSAFYGLTTIEEIQIEDVKDNDSASVLQIIGDKAFYGCTNLKTINFPDSLRTICEHAFDGCKKLTNLTFPTQFSVICESAFANCESLTNLTFNKSLTTIGDKAFENCKSFTSIHFPNSLTTVGKQIISGCSNLTSLTADDPVMGSNYYARENCLIQRNPATIIAGIKTSTIPSDYSGQIREYAFYKLDGLTSINIPNGVDSMSCESFYGCKDLESITVESGNTYYTAVGNCLIDKSTQTLMFGCKNSIIPTDGTVTQIGEEAFAYCEGLTSLVVPECVTKIGKLAFLGCTNLETLTLPFIGTDAENSGGNGLRDLFDLSMHHSSNSVPVKNLIITQGTNVPDNAFKYCSLLASVTLPETITSIGDSAFYYCYNLKNLTIPSSVTSIGNSAFSNCNKLNNITLPTGITTISNNMFYNCSSLQTLTIPNSVTTIGDYAFSNCNKLNNISLPTGLTSLGEGAFSNCGSLTKMTIPASITTIDDYLFQYCSKLATVIIEDGITSIGKNAFKNCTSLTLIVLPTTATNIDDTAFENCPSAKVFFNGDMLAWNAFMNTLAGNGIYNYFISAPVYYYSQNKLSSASGKYWHYANGIPVSW